MGLAEQHVDLAAVVIAVGNPVGCLRGAAWPVECPPFFVRYLAGVNVGNPENPVWALRVKLLNKPDGLDGWCYVSINNRPTPGA
jgi:hypothetical protein